MSERAQSEDRSPGPSARRRLVYVGCTFAAFLVVVELLLQIAGLVTRAGVFGSRASFGQGDAVRILCVGDSHTYGLPLPEEASYPAQLEAALGARHPDWRFDVVNLGIPGTNSAFVANRLERQLHQLRPDLVIVWVGINNLWNVVERRRDEADDRWLSLRTALGHLRLFRLASIAWFNATGHRYDPDRRGGWQPGQDAPARHRPPGVEGGNPAPGLARDLARIARLTASLDTPVVFIAYPLEASEGINRVIREAAALAGVEVVEAQAALLRAAADGHTEVELIDRKAGAHPSRLLYRYIVESMLPVVEATLHAWHGYPLAATTTTGAARPER